MCFTLTGSAKSNLFWPAYCSSVSQNSSLRCQENRILPFHMCCPSFVSSTSSRRECDHRLRFRHKEKRGIFSPIKKKKIFLLLRSTASSYYLSIYFTILRAIFKLGALPQKTACSGEFIPKVVYVLVQTGAQRVGESPGRVVGGRVKVVPTVWLGHAV